MITCGLDFGTSNSAIGAARDGTAALAPIEAGNTLIPSAVFFYYEIKGRVLFGNEAIPAYVPLTFLEADLAITATRVDFDRAVDGRMDRLHRTASAYIAAAGLKPAAIETIFLTGVSSRVPAMRTAIGRAAPLARLAGGSDLLSVALGLTQMAGNQ